MRRGREGPRPSQQARFSHTLPLSPAPCSCSEGKAADTLRRGRVHRLGGPDWLDRAVVFT